MKADDLLKLAKGFNIPNFESMGMAQLEEAVLEAANKHWQEELSTMSVEERAALDEARKEHKEVAATTAPDSNSEDVARASKSDVMRQMVDQGLTVAQIAKALQSNYSFVYSVVKKYKEEGMPVREAKGTKSQIMREMYDKGMKVAEIAKELNANYAFVYGVISRYKAEKGEN